MEKKKLKSIARPKGSLTLIPPDTIEHLSYYAPSTEDLKPSKWWESVQDSPKCDEYANEYDPLAFIPFFIHSLNN